ncbi:transcriptional regulator [Faecalimonas sp.]
MNQIKEKTEELKEIHVDNMHFRVISKHPQYSTDTETRLSRDMRKELYAVFKKYA